MISKGEKWHYLAVRKLSALIGGIKPKHHDGFYGLNCPLSFARDSKFESHKKSKKKKKKIL